MKHDNAPTDGDGWGAGVTVELGKHRRPKNTSSDPGGTPTARFASVDVNMARAHTAKLSNEQRGAYWELYWYQFDRLGYLPDDDELLAEITEMQQAWGALRRKLELVCALVPEADGLSLRVAAQSIEHYRKYRKQRSDAGKASAAKRAAAREAGND